MKLIDIFFSSEDNHMQYILHVKKSHLAKLKKITIKNATHRALFRIKSVRPRLFRCGLVRVPLRLQRQFPLHFLLVLPRFFLEAFLQDVAAAAPKKGKGGLNWERRGKEAVSPTGGSNSELPYEEVDMFRKKDRWKDRCIQQHTTTR